METFRQSFPDQPPPPSPPPPPHFLLQPPPPPPPQSSSGFTQQPTTRAACRIPPGFGLDYLNQRIGHNAEYLGRANENTRRLNNVIPGIQICPEKDTRMSCMINPGFGIGGNAEYYGQGTGRANGNVHNMLYNVVNPGIGRDANGNVDMLYSINLEMQREAEKKKIREEIIAAEMAARRRELEAEVREELRIERELEALKMKGGNAFDSVRVPMEHGGKSLAQEVEGLSLEENVAMSAEERLRIQGITETVGMENPFQRTSLDETGQHQGMEKIICPAKPRSESADSSSTQKEASIPAKGSSAYSVFGVWGVRNMEGKKEWRCFICQVSATSETDLKQHFNGNKHRSKRTAFRAEKRAAATTEQEAEEKAVHLSRTEPLLPMPPALVSAKPSFDGKSASMMLPENKNKAKGKEKFAFWCEMCNAGANNKYVMEAHKKGKKHLERLQKKFPFWCDLCKVGAEREHIMEAHLKGKKHLNMLQEKAAATTSEPGEWASKIV